jgi:Domain of unknown function (DUF1127)
MSSTLSCIARFTRAALARGPAHRLASLDDHTLRDIGLRRTDLYAFADVHRSRIEAACCRMRDVVPCILAGRRPAPCR